MTVEKTPGAKGIIWSSGLHKVFVNKKPARVYASKNTIPQTFDVFQKEIDTNGGITLGIDHIPETLLEQYPVLKKLNVLNVGKITEIAHDNERIYATKSEHTNPLIAELFLNNELEAYSIVADFKASDCPSGEADYVLDAVSGIKRTDYVDEGGCSSCKTGVVPEGMTLTAKLSMEANNMSEENNNEGTGNPGETPAGEGQNPGESEAVYITKEEFEEKLNEKFGEIETLIKEGQAPPADNKVEARVAKIELEAKKSKYKAIVDQSIKEGRVLPVDKEMFIDQGVSMDDESKFKDLMAKRPVIVDLEEQSRIEARAPEGAPTLQDLQAARKSKRF